VSSDDRRKWARDIESIGMADKTKKQTLLVALGGNALIRKGEEGTVEQQFKNLAVPIRQIAKLSRDYKIIITHGNGPQVGNLLLQQDSCDQVPRLPLEILVAQTQGQIGYMIESTLDSQLMDLGIHATPIVSLISYVVVDENDPAFLKPSKPIGPVYKRKKDAPSGYPVRKTAKGYRRVVVSPKPATIVEKREIKQLIDQNFIVICCGGGGIPVVREGRAFSGVDAVIDKDLASARLAEERESISGRIHGPENRGSHAICASQRQTGHHSVDRRNRVGGARQGRHGNPLEVCLKAYDFILRMKSFMASKVASVCSMWGAWAQSGSMMASVSPPACFAMASSWAGVPY